MHDRKQIKSKYLCDVIDPIFVYPEEYPDLHVASVNEINYWIKYLGKDRNKNPKGIIEIDLIENIPYVKNYHEEDGA